MLIVTRMLLPQKTEISSHLILAAGAAGSRRLRLETVAGLMSRRWFSTKGSIVWNAQWAEIYYDGMMYKIILLFDIKDDIDHY